MGTDLAATTDIALAQEMGMDERPWNNGGVWSASVPTTRNESQRFVMRSPRRSRNTSLSSSTTWGSWKRPESS